MEELKGKAAIVTGASKGIGASIAIELARHGVSVIAAARNVSALENLCAAINSDGGKAIALSCDVTRYADVQKTATLCLDQFGSIDILVNNAGMIDPISSLAESDPDQWWNVAEVNYKGVYHGMRAVLPRMRAQGAGTIINISSGAAVSALEGWSHYCSSKAAVLSLTRCADKENRQFGIKVIGLSPGTVATDMQRSIKKSGINPVSALNWDDHIPPEWAARATAYLCTDLAASHSGTDFALRDNANRKKVGLNAD